MNKLVTDPKQRNRFVQKKIKWSGKYDKKVMLQLLQLIHQGYRLEYFLNEIRELISIHFSVETINLE